MMRTIKVFFSKIAVAGMVMIGMTSGSSVHAQINRGDFYFEAFEYGLALQAYEFAYNEQRIQNPFLSRKMALTHRMLGNMEQSMEWYKKTLHRDKSNPQDMLYYAEALKYVQEYKEALRWYKKYNEEVPNDRRAVNHIEDMDYVSKLTRDSVFYTTNRLGMNSPNPEFGITKFKDNYLISYTGVVNPELGEKFHKSEDDRSLYLDVYIFKRWEDNELRLEDWLDGGINSKYHDGPVSYDAVNEQMFITRNNVKKDKPILDKKGKVNLKIYISKMENGVFQEAESLPFNSNEFSNAHPAISPDGKTLYFASNRDGGEGETDLYFVTRTEDGWTEPKNVGSVINTEGEEAFPYVGPDGSLYFSSTGHAGLGGMDIFRSKMVRGSWTKPENLGAPINSNRDDFGLFLDDDGESGYFSSNRASQTIDDDIFYFEYDPSITIRGKVQEAGNLDALEDALVRLFDADGNIILETKADTDGYFDFVLEPDDCEYRVEISNGTDYTTQNEMINICDKRLSFFDIGTKTIGQMNYLAIGTVREKGTGQPVKGFNSTLYNADTGDKINSLVTDFDGRIEFSLAPETNYKMTFQKEGWFAKSASFSTVGMAPGTVEIEKYVSLVFEEIVVEKPIEVENIYYDYNKFFVRDDAKPELDKLVKMMEDNPTISIELSSHTDARGSDKYNLVLSEQRAKAAVEYIVLKGVEKDRIQSKGYGEKALRNKCQNGVQCSEDEHEENRRTEFKVLKY
jgi:outer membrane protein OmpA-like peptidoglycan-associated protein/tetratricopeptide (TPR) repeat protein